MALADVTVLIPTYNAGFHLEQLCRSILASGLFEKIHALIIVDDGSTDNTAEVLVRLKADEKIGPKLVIVPFEKNRGRFFARYEGAKKAASEWILFLDSRITIQRDFVSALDGAVARGFLAVGWPEIDIRKNIFCLYWQRSHESIFSRHYRITGPLELTLANYDKYLKGTGGFLCRSAAFVEVCRQLEHLEVRSDDTLLMKELLRTDRMFIDPALKLSWEPRADWAGFLLRLFDRGPGFVEYHVFKRQGLFFLIVACGLVLTVGWLALLFYDFETGIFVLAAGLAAIGLSTALFSRSATEFVRLLPLHILVVLFFGTGVLWGLVVNTIKLIKIK